MQSFFNRLLDWFRSFFKQQMELTLVGLQLSGKTTFLNVISSGVYNENTIPTLGFNIKNVTKGRVTIKIWDIGGQPRFRQLWERYCRSVNCIIFMVDAADYDKLEQATIELNELVAKPLLTGIPLLVLANKRDLPNALTDKEIIAKMDLTSIADREVCCYSISCKDKTNIDVTLDWITKHSKKDKK